MGKPWGIEQGFDGLVHFKTGSLTKASVPAISISAPSFLARIMPQKGLARLQRAWSGRAFGREIGISFGN